MSKKQQIINFKRDFFERVLLTLTNTNILLIKQEIYTNQSITFLNRLVKCYYMVVSDIVKWFLEFFSTTLTAL